MTWNIKKKKVNDKCVDCIINKTAPPDGRAAKKNYFKALVSSATADIVTVVKTITSIALAALPETVTQVFPLHTVALGTDLQIFAIGSMYYKLPISSTLAREVQANRF